MVETVYFKLEVFINDTNINLGNTAFNSLELNESLNDSAYTITLNLNNIFGLTRANAVFVTGERVRLEYTLFDYDKKTTYKYSMRVFNFFVYQSILKVILIPDILYYLLKDKLTVGYNDTIDNIVIQILNKIKTDNNLKIDVAIGTDDSNTKTDIVGQSRLFLQLNQHYFGFIKYISQYTSNKYADYIFMISKSKENDKVILMSYDTLANNKKEILELHDKNMSSYSIENFTLGLQLAGGLGGTGIYFDWDKNNFITITSEDTLKENGKFKNYAKGTTGVLGINNDLINKNNTLMMLSPIGDKLYSNKNYNSYALENSIIRKNLFDVYLQVTCVGNIDVCVGDFISIKLSDKSNDLNEDYNYSGKYMIYTNKLIINKEGLKSNLTLSSPSTFNLDKTKFK